MARLLEQTTKAARADNLLYLKSSEALALLPRVVSASSLKVPKATDGALSSMSGGGTNPQQGLECMLFKVSSKLSNSMI